MRPGARRLAHLQQNDKAVVIYTTFPSVEAAEEVGGALVDAGLAACVNILAGMVSIYVWKGERNRDGEAVMLIKTRRSLAERVIAETAARHPYENPAIVVLPIESGAEPYLGWIMAQTAAAAPREADG